MENADNIKTLEQLKNEVRQFCEERGWNGYHGPKDLAIGLSTEANELLEIFRFVSEEDSFKKTSEPKFREEMADELADSLFFILRFAQMYEFDLSECLQKKIKKNSVKYPVGANDYVPRASRENPPKS